jgi:prophage regulatory protein
VRTTLRSMHTEDASKEPAIAHSRLLRLPEVLKLYPVSKSSWYAGMAEGRYPAAVKLSKRSVAWRQSDIEALIERTRGC